MLVAAVLVPDTVLLLPGVAGRGPDPAWLADLRSAAVRAVRDAVRSAGRVVVVAPGRASRTVVGTVAVGAAAAGVPDHLLRDPVPSVRLAAPPTAPTPGPAAGGAAGTGTSVGLHLVLAAGPSRTDVVAGAPDEEVPGLHAVEVAPAPAATLRAQGARLCADVPTALVVVGSGSARHGADAPLPGDERAAALDADLLAALRSGSGPGRDALADLDAARCAELAVTGWGPWQVLVGALDVATGPVADPRVMVAGVHGGAAHAVVAWDVA